MDDEEIEREGMAQLIPWDDAYEMKAAGTARNSAEGLKKKNCKVQARPCHCGHQDAGDERH